MLSVSVDSVNLCVEEAKCVKHVCIVLVLTDILLDHTRFLFVRVCVSWRSSILECNVYSE